MVSNHFLKRVPIVVVIFALITTACGSLVQPPPQIIVVTATSAPATLAPTATPIVVTPTPTDTPTVTPTATLGPPMFTANVDLNCRMGPSTDYPRLSWVLSGESVLIVGQTTPDREVWWLVKTRGETCWVSGAWGWISGNLFGLPVIPAPPVPTPTPITIDVAVNNQTGGPVCRLDFYVGITRVATFPFKKGEFKNGWVVELPLPIGHYDLIEAYNCKPRLVASLPDVTVNGEFNQIVIGRVVYQ